VFVFAYEPEGVELFWSVTRYSAQPKDGTYWMPVIAKEPYYFVMRYYKPDLDNIPEKPCN